jgi:hypothetical protein
MRLIMWGLGIGILRIEISDDARVLAVAQPIVIIDAAHHQALRIS